MAPAGQKYVQYYCRTCATGCINSRIRSRTRYRECESCHSVPVLDRGDPVDRIRPSLLWAVHAALSDLDLVPFVGSSIEEEGAWQFVQECTEDTILNWYRREHDLDGVRFNSSDGWVDWYRYGDNDLSREEDAERAGQHDLVNILSAIVA